MKQNNWEQKPSSFADTVQLVENYVRREIVQETKNKQLFYHTLDHADAVKRRANLIFAEIRPCLAQSFSFEELNRSQLLMNVSAIAHDMVQEFTPPEDLSRPRRHLVGISEAATTVKLIEYIQDLNRELAKFNLEPSILFSDQDIVIIEDSIRATICDLDPQAGEASYSFSSHSIYQPYLYNPETKPSIIGSIIALADLGTLGIDGIEPFIQDGIMIFLEDNPDLLDFILHHGFEPSGTKNNLLINLTNDSLVPAEFNSSVLLDYDSAKTRLTNMNRFMVNLAKERYARLEVEIAGFAPPVRHILKEKIFIYLNTENIKKVVAIIPTDKNTGLSELIDFFYANYE